MDAEDDKTISRKDMSNWQDLTLEERMVILQQVAKTEKIPQSAIEKDWWVTAVLKAIFQTEAAPKMLFKGGTSLSKGWHLIERLSEDVDLAIDHTFFGNIWNLAGKILGIFQRIDVICPCDPVERNTCDT